MVGFQLTGHPDWIATNSTPIPVLAAELGTFAANTSWNAGSVDVSSGGAYMLTVTPATAGDTCVTDITVQHYDVNGTLMHTDFFGAVFSGGNANMGLITSAATIVRGNQYGATIKISGQTASAAWVNSVSGSAGLTTVGATINCYILPNGLGDPDPRMNNGSCQVVDAVGATPGNVLTFLNGGTVSAGESLGPYWLVPYSGPAVATVRQNGLTTTPSNFRFTLTGYTVANGTGGILQAAFDTPANLTLTAYDLNIPACLMVANYANEDSTQSTVPLVTIIAGRAA
jgi:hypothetical protein